MFKRKNPDLGVNPASSPRNAFDLSERHLYTQAPGMLLPVFVKDMNPDERIKVDFSSQIQAQTLKGRAFIGMQQQFAAYFVPYRYLWSYWQSFVTGLSTNNTITSSLMINKNVPSSLKAPCFNPYQVLVNGFGNISSFGKPSEGNPKSFVSDSAYDSLGYSFNAGFARLFDMLGYGALYQHKDNKYSDDLMQYQLNAFRFLAYQKIYQDHFLDDRFEQRHPEWYNVDNCSDDNGRFLCNAQHFFEPRYAKYNRDLLTNFQPAPLFISNVDNKIKAFTGTLPFTSDSLREASFSSGSTVLDRFRPDLDGGQTRSDTGFATARDDINAITASTIRNLFALDKMAQISSRAAKTYRAQMLAHYGVSVSDDSRLSMYCGGSSFDLDSTPVIATADGAKDGSNLFGEQSSFIDNRNGGSVDFESKDFGVFMIISWLSPSPRWDSLGLDPFNKKSVSEDYFHPETADLGLQPLTTDMVNSLDFIYSSGAGVFPETQIGDFKSSAEKVYGWSPRYSEYKSSFDKLHGEFRKPIKFHKDSKVVPFTQGSLSFLTTHNSRLTTIHDAITLYDISVSPGCLDDVVEVAYNGLESTDPFRVDTSFGCVVVRNMSVNGLPRIN